MKDIKNLLRILELRLNAIDKEIPNVGQSGNVVRFHYLAGARDAHQEVHDILSGKIEILTPKMK